MSQSKLELIIELSNRMFNQKLKQTQDKYNSAVNKLKGKAAEVKIANGRAMNALTGQFPAIERGMDMISNKYVLMAAAAGGVGFLIGKSMKVGIEDEMQRTSFEVMLGGKKAAKGLIDEISTYAKKSPYEKLGLGDAAKTMLGFGIASEKVMPNLRMIGDIAMGDAQKMESITRAFSQASAAGKLTGEDLNQMIDAGFNPLKEMSRTTGLSMGELRKQMEKGLISTEMLEGAFKSATGPGGQFNGMAEKMSQTVGGKLSSMIDAFKNMLLGLFNVIQPFLVPAINALTWALEGIVPMFQWVVSEFQKGNPWFWTLAWVIGSIVTALIAYNAYTYLAAVRTSWLAGTTKVQIMWSRISTVATWAKIAALWALSRVTSFMALVTNKAAMAQKFQSIWSWAVTAATWAWNAATWAVNAALYANPIVWIILLIGALVAAIIWVVKNWDTFTASWKMGWAMAKGVMFMAGNSIANAFNMMGYDIKILWNKFKGFFQWVGAAFNNLGKSIKLALSGDFSGAKKALFAPIITEADKEIAMLQKSKNKAYSSYLKEQTAVKKDMQKAVMDYVELASGKKKSKAEKQNDKLVKDAKDQEGKKPKILKPETNLNTGGNGGTTPKGQGAGDQVTKVTGAGQEVKNITVNIDSFVKGGINTSNTSMGKMDAKELENWFNETLLRTIRSLELGMN